MSSAGGTEMRMVRRGGSGTVGRWGGVRDGETEGAFAAGHKSALFRHVVSFRACACASPGA
eukprot:2561019-Rhodomonas_salina.1